MAPKSEFTVSGSYTYNRSSPLRWIWSHIWRYRLLFILTLCLYGVAWTSFGYGRVLIGEAAEAIMNPDSVGSLPAIALTILLVLLVGDSLSALLGSLSVETIAQRLSRDAREELYTSLLGKSQTFHDRQRVGDIMARATDDVQQLNVMVNPGILFISEIVLGLVVPMTYIAGVRPDLLLIPIIFVLLYAFNVRHYMRRLNPVIGEQREAYGIMNAGLEESISGIEIVKASAQEPFERQ